MKEDLFFTPEGQAATGHTIYTGNNGPFHMESLPIRFQAWMEALRQFIKTGAKANLVPKYQAKVQMLAIAHVNLDLMNSGGPTVTQLSVMAFYMFGFITL